MEVVNVKKAHLKKHGYKDFEDWNKDPNHVYIGRDMQFYVKGTVGSKWANPYSLKKYKDLSREKCVEMYREYLLSQPDLIKSLPELKGKILGCWCADAYPSCHGDILMELVAELENDEPKPKINLTRKQKS